MLMAFVPVKNVIVILQGIRVNNEDVSLMSIGSQKNIVVRTQKKKKKKASVVNKKNNNVQNNKRMNKVL